MVLFMMILFWCKDTNDKCLMRKIIILEGPETFGQWLHLSLGFSNKANDSNWLGWAGITSLVTKGFCRILLRDTWTGSWPDRSVTVSSQYIFKTESGFLRITLVKELESLRGNQVTSHAWPLLFSVSRRREQKFRTWSHFILLMSLQNIAEELGRKKEKGHLLHSRLQSSFRCVSWWWTLS